MNFGDMRSFFHSTKPSPKAWQALCELIESMKDFAEREQALLYAEQMLLRWPDEYRMLMPHWLHDIGLDLEDHQPPHPAWHLARYIALSHFEGYEEIYETPLMARLAVFNASGLWFNDDVILRLVHSEHVKSMEALILTTALLYMDDWEVFAQSRWMGQLRFLDLNNNGVTDEKWATFLNHVSSLDALEVLILTVNQLTDVGVQRMATTSMPSLRYLDIGQCNLGEASAVALASAGFDKLESLLLPRNAIGASGIQALSQTEDLIHLKALDVCHNQLGDVGARALANSPYLTALTHLDLEGNGITDDGARALANSPYLANVQTLYFEGNQLTQKGRDALLNSPLRDAVHFTAATVQLPPPMLGRRLSEMESHLEWDES